MSIISCLLTKLAYQKKAFAEGQSYESLPDAERMRILNAKEGYLKDTHVQQMTALMKEKIDQGLSEGDAAQYVHDALATNLQHMSVTSVSTSNAVTAVSAEIDRAIQKGIPLKHLASGLFNSSPGRDMLHGGVLQDVIPFNQLVHGAKTRAAGLLSEVADAMPPSMFGTRNAATELEAAKALFGESSDPKFSAMADKLHTFVQSMNQDLTTLGMRTIDEDRLLQGVMGRGDKIRRNMKWGGNTYTTFMERPEIFDWSTLQKMHPGQLESQEQQLAFIKELTKVAQSEGTYKAPDHIDGTKLYFKNPEDWAEFNAKYGQGGLLNVLQAATENYAREFATGKLTGGNFEAWKAGIAQKIGEVAPSEAAEFMNKMNQGIANKKITFAGDVDGLQRKAGDLLKDITVMAHIGYSGVAGILHSPMGAIAAWQRGVSSPVGEGFSNIVRSIFGGSGYTEYLSRLAQAGVNSDRVLTTMGRSLDENLSNPVSRAFKKASSSVYNMSQLPNVMIATKSATSNVVQQDIARILESGVSVEQSGMYGLRTVGITDNDLALLKQHAYHTNNDYGHGFPDLDLSKAWNAGPEAQNAALKVMHLMDDIGRAGAPHVNDAWHDQLSRMRNSGPLGQWSAALIGPLTGYLVTSGTHTIAPAFRAPNVAGKLGWGTSVIAGMASLGMLNVQIRRLKDGKDFLPFGMPLLTQGLSCAGIGSVLMSLTSDLGTNSKSDGSFLERALPAYGLIRDAVPALQHELVADIQGKSNHRRALDARKVMSDFGVGSSLPMVGLLQDRLLTGPIWNAISPGEINKQNQNKIAFEKKQKSGYWWKPGESTPDHNPITGQ